MNKSKLLNMRFFYIVLMLCLNLTALSQVESWDKYVNDTIPLLGGVSGEHIIVSREFFSSQDSIYIRPSNLKIIDFTFEAFGWDTYFINNSGKFTPRMRTLITTKRFTMYYLYDILAINDNGEIFKVRPLLVSVYDE